MGSVLESWIAHSLSTMSLTKEASQYLAKRGAKESSVKSLGVVVWTCPDEPCPDASFCVKYGERGERFINHIIYPYLSPRGGVLGFEARSIDKSIFDVRVRAAKWNPVWFGLLESEMLKIWEGALVWVVEGVFDKFPLEWVVSSDDVILVSVHASLSRNQHNFLKRFCKGQVNVVFDMDNPGRRGAQKGVKFLIQAGIACRDVEYKGGKDPGVIWDRYGVEGLRKAFRFFLGR